MKSSNFSSAWLNPVHHHTYKTLVMGTGLKKPTLEFFSIVNNSPPLWSGTSIDPVMENHIKLTSSANANGYLRAFQVAQFNFYLFNQEEQMNKKRFKAKSSRRKEG